MWQYRLILLLLAIPLGIYTLWQAIRHRNSYYLQERLGLFRTDIPTPHDIWIHAASVGEVNAVMPLILHIEKECKNISIILTVTTPTGAEIAKKKLPAKYSCHFLPIDWKYAITRFLDSMQPSYVLITETELWPNVFKTCSDRKIPLTIINGRLSSRTMNARSWIKGLYATMLPSAKAILTRSQIDYDRFISLGADRNSAEVIGNLKFAPQDVTSIKPIQIDRPYILAASTRDKEEKIIVKVWKKLDTKNRLLVIAPRHPHRMQQILRDLSPLDIDIAVRSRNDPIRKSTQVYLVDTIGELTSFMVNAELVFMGGSLVPLGGQNILEPAQEGKAILFGPYMENFADEARLLTESGAALQASDEAHLHSLLSVLLTSPEKIQSMEESAGKVMLENNDILERYLLALRKLCPALEENCQ